MHIVAITGSFYPNVMAPSACVKPYLQDLAKEHDVEVVCPVSNLHFSECVEIEGIKIHFVSSWINDRFVKTHTHLQENKHHMVSKFTSIGVRVFKYLQEEILPKPYDSTLVDAYLIKLKELNNESSIDVIISVTYPFHTHVVGLKYKELYPSVKWLTYTTDPLAYNEANPIAPWKKKSAIKIEKQVYDACDTCIITEELFDNVVKDYNINPDKVLTLPYLVETENVPREERKNINSKAQVLYAGCLFYRVRDPRTMLGVFSKLTNVDLRLYVTGDRQCRKMLKEKYPSNIHINEVVPRDEYFRLLSQADVLVNLSNNAKLQAPHKLMELVSTGKPIINFYYYRNAGYSIIEKYPLGINIANSSNPDEMVAVVEGFVADNRDKRLSEIEIREIFKEYLLAYQIKNIKALFQN